MTFSLHATWTNHHMSHSALWETLSRPLPNHEVHSFDVWLFDVKPSPPPQKTQNMIKTKLWHHRQWNNHTDSLSSICSVQLMKSTHLEFQCVSEGPLCRAQPWGCDSLRRHAVSQWVICKSSSHAGRSDCMTHWDSAEQQLFLKSLLVWLSQTESEAQQWYF